jgi:hypothetical protein
LGFSNAKAVERVVVIAQSPFANLPEDICAGLDEALENSLNEGTREKKRKRLTSWNSEDHLTWVIFRYLQLRGQLRVALARAGVSFAPNAPSDPTVLFWGSPLPAADHTGKALRAMIESIEVSLDEGCRERSEPDVILDFGSRGVVFVEAKLRSDNDATPADYANWPKYFKDSPPFKSTEAVRQSGHYQLARNWRLAWALAGGRSMALVNLGQDILFTGKENRRRLDQFKSGLATSETSQFVEATWKEIIGPAGSELPHLMSGGIAPGM